MRSSDFRAQARWALRGKWKVMMGLMLLAQAVMNSFGLPTLYAYMGMNRITSNAELLRVLLQSGPDEAMSIFMASMRPDGIGWVILALIALFSLLGFVVVIGQYRAASMALDDHWPGVRTLFPLRLLGKAVAAKLLLALLILLAEIPMIAILLLVGNTNELLIMAAFSLMCVPMILIYYRYSMVDFLLAENPDFGPVKALRESRRRMKGSCIRLFGLQLSFLGWGLLISFIPDVLGFVPLLSGWAYIIAELILMWLAGAALDAYIYTAEAAFFRDILHGSAKREWREANAGAWNQEPHTEAREEAEDAPEGDSDRQYTVLRPDETVAKDVFMQHGCSRMRLREEGLLEEYERMGVDSSMELRWVRDYGQQLMLRFSRDPNVLDELLILIGEYAMDDLASRVLERIERHIRQQTLPDDEILNMAGRVLALLESGAFAENDGFVRRKREQVSDMADRLEHRLSEAQPEGGWREALRLVRMMCNR